MLCSLLAGLVGPAGEHVVHSRCSRSGTCSEELQAAMTACSAVEECAVTLAPPSSDFDLEQAGPLRLTGAVRFTLDGQGARLRMVRADVGFMRATGCVRPRVMRLGIWAARPAFTFGTVRPSRVPGWVQLRVNGSEYPPALWSGEAVALHQVEPLPPFAPARDGADWIGPPLALVPGGGGVRFRDLGFGLPVGAGVVLRHTLEFTRRMLDTLVFASCRDVAVQAVTITSSPGMGVLAWNCTGVQLEGVRNVPSGTRAPMAGNADAMHLASCRGRVRIAGCVGDRQGDDGLNVHGQYAVVRSSGPGGRLIAGPHDNVDGTGWDSLFARPAFSVGDTVSVLRAAGLTEVLRGTVLRVHHGATVDMTLSGDASAAAPGDVVVSLDAQPSQLLIERSNFTGSRASGIVLLADNVVVDQARIEGVSAAAVAIGGYFSAFGEAPLGSNITVLNTRIAGNGRGHRTVSGGHWGGGGGGVVLAPISAAPNATRLHLGIAVRRSTVLSEAGPAVAATAVTGLVVEDNTLCASNFSGSPVQCQECLHVSERNNSCILH